MSEDTFSEVEVHLYYNFRDDIRRRGKTAVSAYMDAFRDLKNFLLNVKKHFCT